MNRYRQGSKIIDRRNLLKGLAGVGALNSIGSFPYARALSSSHGEPVASTEYGRVRGIESGNVLSFRGVPYGGLADDVNRFKAPQRPAPWKEVRDASKAGPRAIQIAGKNIFSDPRIGDYFSGGRKDAPQITFETDSENCLVLNVLTPGLSGKRPVMVYIHGGGFIVGSGALTLVSDRFVAEQDVVLVGINHRLSVFGYTYLGEIDPTYADSGNVGQLDLIAALQWVRNNIANFGGNPSNVTIFGESGGGAKVSTLLAMPGAKGLFRRAVIESGSFRSVRTKQTATRETKKMLSELGLAVSQVDQLKQIPADKLLAASLKAAEGLGGPVIDGRSVPHPTWDPAAPLEADGITLIIGNCKDETTLYSLGDPALFSLDWQTLTEREGKAGISEDKAEAIVNKYREGYPKDTASDLYFRIAADRSFRRNAIAQAEAKLRQKEGDVYMYNFAWNTPVDGGRLRAFHTAELPLAMRLVFNPEAEELSKQIAGAWAGFARTGNPNHSALPHWEKYSLEKRSTMVFDAGKTALVSHPAEDELALLESLSYGFPFDF